MVHFVLFVVFFIGTLGSRLSVTALQEEALRSYSDNLPVNENSFPRVLFEERDLLAIDSEEVAVGTDDLTGINYTFSGISANSSSQIVLLNLEVHLGDFNDDDEFISINISSLGSTNWPTIGKECKPRGIQCAGIYFQCFTELDVTDIAAASGDITVQITPSAEVGDVCVDPINDPDHPFRLHVKISLAYTRPDIFPILAPMTVIFQESHEAGTNYPLGGIFHEFDYLNLDRATDRVYLSADVYAGDFGSIDHRAYLTVFNFSLLTCRPILDCIGTFYRCADRLDITDEVFARSTSQVDVLISTSEEVGSGCPYLGYAFYAKLEVTVEGTRDPSTQPRGSSSSSFGVNALIVGIALGSVALIIAMGMFVVYRSRSSKSAAREMATVHPSYAPALAADRMEEGERRDSGGSSGNVLGVSPTAPPLPAEVSLPVVVFSPGTAELGSVEYGADATATATATVAPLGSSYVLASAVLAEGGEAGSVKAISREVK